MKGRHVKVCPTAAERDLPFVVPRHRGAPKSETMVLVEGRDQRRLEVSHAH